MRDQRTDLIEQLRAEPPLHPAESALDRVHARVKSRRTLESATRRGPAWRTVGSLATAAVLIAVTAVAIAPRMGATAFAQDKAASALLFHAPGRILHVEMVYTHETEGEPKNQWLNQRWSVWVDADGRRMREQFVNSGDGSLADLRVWIDDRWLAYWLSNRRQGFAEAEGQQPLRTVMDDEVSYMRQRIADGSAKVTGTQVIDGDKYWVVKSDSGAGENREIVTMTLRTSDYRPKTWKREDFGSDDSGRPQVTTKRIVFNVIEQLEPTAIPDGFFSFDAVTDAALPGVPVVTKTPGQRD